MGQEVVDVSFKCECSSSEEMVDRTTKLIALKRFLIFLPVDTPTNAFGIIVATSNRFISMKKKTW